MEILSVSNQYHVWFLIVPVVVVSLFMWIGVYEYFKKKNHFVWITLLMLIVVSYTGTISAIVTQSNKKELKVTIHNMDEVDFEKYDLVDIEGKIITLREK